MVTYQKPTSPFEALEASELAATMLALVGNNLILVNITNVQNKCAFYFISTSWLAPK